MIKKFPILVLTLILSMTPISFINAMVTETDDAHHLTTRFMALKTLNDDDESCAQAISVDGNVVMGWIKKEFSEEIIPCYWKQTEDIQIIDGGNEKVVLAKAVSSHANVIIGDAMFSDSEDIEAKSFYWATGSEIQFPDIFNTGQKKWLQAVSADGKEVIGWTREGAENNGVRIFHWTQEEGMQFFEDLSVDGNTTVSALSVDGKAATGWIQGDGDDNPTKTFLWTQENGMELPDSLNFNADIFVSAINTNGRIIVGHPIEKDETTIPFRWTKETGLQSISELLKLAGQFPEDWTLQRVYGLSGDGTMIVGIGNYKGKNRAWLVNIPQ